jgi:hypothetical protein
MSDTTAFLAGCAVTGVAAILLLRAGIGISQPRFIDPVQPPPAVTELPTPVAVPSSASTMVQDSIHQMQLERDLEDQKTNATELKNQLEKQRDQIEKLQTQIEKYQANIDQLTSQLQEQQRLVTTLTAQQTTLASPSESSVKLQTVAIWVVGGVLIIVAIVGGMILIGVVVLLVLSQRRAPRTMHVVQPLTTSYTLPQPQLLPPQTRVRRPKPVDSYSDPYSN